MFELSDDTRAAVIAYLREQMELSQVDYTDEQLNGIIDGVVDIVKRQFGM